jgi:diguanylate cyclase (GGDEF)-like protein
MPVESVSTASLSTPATALLAAGLDVAYQPIVDLGSGAVIAYEALARPRHPDVRNPFEFFRSLEQAGLRLPGERAAFEAALSGVAHGFPRVKLFLNASPLTLVDPEFDVLELVDLIGRCGVAANDVVIEVTESEEVDDLAALSQRTQRLRRLGIGVAVDDAGAGHASFRVITRLRPSYIKIDRDLVSNVDSDGARHAFIEALVRFSRQIGSRLIAEGIETQGELASLAGLGVEAGQGYYLARPALGAFEAPSPDSRRMIAFAAQRLRLGSPVVTAAEIARPPAVVQHDVSVREAYERFCAEPDLRALVVVTDGRLAGQISRRALERALAVPGCWPAVADRSALQLVDPQPLTVRADLDVSEVGAIVAAREHDAFADDVVVTDQRGRVVGAVGIREVVRTLAELQRPGEDDLHPVSGLVGAGWVEHELTRRLATGQPTTVLFLDVDNLRLVNAALGFRLGDELLRALGRCLVAVATRVPDAAAAHLGGDDFVLLVPPDRREELVSGVVRGFESDVVPDVRVGLSRHAAGHVVAQLGLSIAAVDLEGAPPPGHRYLQWASMRLAAPLRTAQDHAGYACVYDGPPASLTTWRASGTGDRTIRAGRVEPHVVLAAAALCDRAWASWWDTGEDSDGLPGPRDDADALLARYCRPLQDAARAAQLAGDRVVDVTLSGPEVEVLAVLDRIALVTRGLLRGRSPEVALLQRLLRHRARVLTREDIGT